jgi:hypothetical protein
MLHVMHACKKLKKKSEAPLYMIKLGKSVNYYRLFPLDLVQNEKKFMMPEQHDKNKFNHLILPFEILNCEVTAK